MWDTLILNPLINTMIWLYGLLGNNIFLAILVLTIVIYMITLPLTLQQQKSMQATQELQPKLEEIKKKYKSEPEKLQAAQMELYKEAGINPFGGCLPLLIQFPILIGLYQSITRSLAASPIQLLDLSQHIYYPVPEFLRWLPNAPALIPLNSRFLWLDLAQPDPRFILPVLVVITTFLTNRMMTPQNRSTDPQQQQMQTMQLMMPIMIGWFSLNFPAGLSIYWITSNLVRFAQYVATGRANFSNLLGMQDGKFSLSGLLGLPSQPPAEPEKKRSARPKQLPSEQKSNKEKKK
jgi:YidC/Oxa1 family membrane protein insertase